MRMSTATARERGGAEKKFTKLNDFCWVRHATLGQSQLWRLMLVIRVNKSVRSCFPHKRIELKSKESNLCAQSALFNMKTRFTQLMLDIIGRNNISSSSSNGSDDGNS